MFRNESYQINAHQKEQRQDPERKIKGKLKVTKISKKAVLKLYIHIGQAAMNKIVEVL